MYGKIVTEGHWEYNGQSLRVWITLHNEKHGLDDNEYPPEIREDQTAPTYYVWFEPSGGGKPRVGVYFASLPEALAHVEEVASCKVVWRAN